MPPSDPSSLWTRAKRTIKLLVGGVLVVFVALLGIAGAFLWAEGRRDEKRREEERAAEVQRLSVVAQQFDALVASAQDAVARGVPGQVRHTVEDLAKVRPQDPAVIELLVLTNHGHVSLMEATHLACKGNLEGIQRLRPASWPSAVPRSLPAPLARVARQLIEVRQLFTELDQAEEEVRRAEEMVAEVERRCAKGRAVLEAMSAPMTFEVLERVPQTYHQNAYFIFLAAQRAILIRPPGFTFTSPGLARLVIFATDERVPQYGHLPHVAEVHPDIIATAQECLRPPPGVEESRRRIASARRSKEEAFARAGPLFRDACQPLSGAGSQLPSDSAQVVDPGPPQDATNKEASTPSPPDSPSASPRNELPPEAAGRTGTALLMPSVPEMRTGGQAELEAGIGQGGASPSTSQSRAGRCVASLDTLVTALPPVGGPITGEVVAAVETVVGARLATPEADARKPAAGVLKATEVSWHDLDGDGVREALVSVVVEGPRSGQFENEQGYFIGVLKQGDKGYCLMDYLREVAWACARVADRALNVAVDKNQLAITRSSFDSCSGTSLAGAAVKTTYTFDGVRLQPVLTAEVKRYWEDRSGSAR